MGKPWENIGNHGKTMGQTWENVDETNKHVDFHGVCLWLIYDR